MTAKSTSSINSQLNSFPGTGGRVAAVSKSTIQGHLQDIFDSVGGGIKYVTLQAIAAATDQTTGDGKTVFGVPPSLNGHNLVYAAAYVGTAGVTGTADIQIRNVTDSVDMLSTKITIASTENYTADGVIDITKDDVATGDILAIDLDAIHSGTAAKGLFVVLGFEMP